ncbi:hypothetical protein [Georgenia sp. SUBG003]|uniref:hypothetical protein n=1 Tax=Georgenia sp. SUBG003 TaxID=1497974 RepID=UPI003AB72308
MVQRGDGAQPPQDGLAQVERLEHERGLGVGRELLGEQLGVGVGQLDDVTRRRRCWSGRPRPSPTPC